MNIRTATHDDIPELIALNDEVQAIHVALAPDVFLDTDKAEVAKWFSEMLDNEPTVILVAEHEGAVIGYINFRKQLRPAHAFAKERRCGYIDQVCVTKRHRGKGVFTDFMNEVKRIAEEWAVDRIELDVWSANTDAKKAFIGHGFETYTEHMKMCIGRAPRRESERLLQWDDE